MLLDCAIIGGGPSGLNASLVLARAQKNVVLFDDDKPRNAVTQQSHGFITRDGIKPSEFKKMAKKDLMKYPNLTIQNERVIHIKKENQTFMIDTNDGHSYRSRKIILSTGLKDVLPNIEGIHDFYGTSLFNCPFCDGWELKDRPLVLISEDERAVHMAKLIVNWSKDLVVCTNGKNIFSNEQKELITKKKINVIEKEIIALKGENGHLETIQFKGGEEIRRDGGFVTTGIAQASSLAENLGCNVNKMGGIETDPFCRTNIDGVYVSGDASIIAPAQLVIAAGEGSKVAISVVHDLVNEDF